MRDRSGVIYTSLSYLEYQHLTSSVEGRVSLVVRDGRVYVGGVWDDEFTEGSCSDEPQFRKEISFLLRGLFSLYNGSSLFLSERRVS